MFLEERKGTKKVQMTYQFFLQGLMDTSVVHTKHIENTSNLYFRHMNMHENGMPDPFFILPELKSKQKDELLMFL